MEEENQLTLEEMLSLAEKVENWENPIGDDLQGSLKDIGIEMGLYPSGKLLQLGYDYHITIEHKLKNIILGKLKINETKEEGKKIGLVYNIAMKQAKENYKIARRQIRENEQKEREDALNYVRGLLTPQDDELPIPEIED